LSIIFSKLKSGMVVAVNLDPALSPVTGKIKPHVIMTNDLYNERVPVIQVVPITLWSAKKL
jgi:mRNA interferase MazF